MLHFIFKYVCGIPDHLDPQAITLKYYPCSLTADPSVPVLLTGIFLLNTDSAYEKKQSLSESDLFYLI